MTRMIKFPSIAQFRNVIHTVVNRARYIGKDENGEAIYNPAATVPTLPFEGTVKLHGTNAGVAHQAGETWCQSRENIISVASDNAGFATWVHGQRELFAWIFDYLKAVLTPTDDQAILVFGEWCGGSIQTTVALRQVPKMFVVFNIAVVDAEGEKVWHGRNLIQAMFDEIEFQGKSIPALRHTRQFPTYQINIDFDRPHGSQEELSALTLAVEKECPVAKALGAVPNDKGMIVGEGIVWTCSDPAYQDSGYWFKVKGEEHSPKTKVKTMAAVDVQRLDSISELADTLCPEWRLEQMYQQTFDTLNGGKPDIKRTGDFIRAMMSDIVKEESDTLAASGFTTKEINGRVSKHARDYLIKQLDELAFS